MTEYKGDAPRYNDAMNQMMRFYDEYSSSRMWTYKHKEDALARVDGIAAKLIERYEHADFSFKHDSFSMCLMVRRKNMRVMLTIFHRLSFIGGLVYAVELYEGCTAPHCDGDDCGVYKLPLFYHMNKNAPDASD